MHSLEDAKEHYFKIKGKEYDYEKKIAAVLLCVALLLTISFNVSAYENKTYLIIILQIQDV